MSDTAGVSIPISIALAPAGQSPSLAATWPGGYALALATLPSFGTASSFTPIDIVHSDSAGIVQEIIGQELKNKILVSPRNAALGFAAPGTEFPMEVWNTYPSTQTLTAISFTPGAGLDIADPYGVPVDFATFQSRVYIATVSANGPPQMSQSVEFVFSGISGTDVLVTYTQLVLFSLAPDWSAGIKETVSYLTNVLSAYSDNEQRRGLRSMPRRSFAVRYTTVDARSAALLDALLWGWQQHPFGVPMWPDAVTLWSDLPAGSTVITLDTADRLFVPEGFCCVWDGPFSFDVAVIETMDSASITLRSPTQLAHKVGAQVVPVVLARLKPDLSLVRYSSVGDEIDLAFDAEGSQLAPDLPGATTPPQYRGIDVLETAPNWGVEMTRNYKRSLTTLDSQSGGIWVDDRGGSALVGTPLPWFLATHADVTPLRSFFDQRRGRLSSFWLPTWDCDLILAAPIVAASTTLTILYTGYTRFMFSSPARRHLAFIRNAAAPIFREVTASVENTDGTETLTLNLGPGADLDADVQVSFLALSRLDTDDIVIEWASTEQGSATLATRELPREVPT
jgi:hypothetical protein